MSEEARTFRFSSDNSKFIDYVEAARGCPRAILTTQPNLGLVNSTCEHAEHSTNESRPWSQLYNHVRYLNRGAELGTSHKIIFIVRHGRGFHNVVMDEVGSASWKTHWSKLDGDGNRTWSDADVIMEGREQAKSLGTFFQEGVRDAGFPVPDTIYTSPLSRCLETTKLVFKDLVEAQGQTFRPFVKERLRERLTGHTCDRRKTADCIKANYPEFELEPEFTNSDELWHGNQSESNKEHVARSHSLFEDIWSKDTGTVIALITHSYTLSSILEVIGAPHFRVGEAVMTAFLVKGERVAVT